ncbi:unnamed protein product [Ceutorhynchus assimilis]|uniref:TGF-beta family profile domain-containing protein n=1 Tax=Ceutorhynchus assimilis TaxID=467358 RepID=A0A9N9MMG6_9CUCU|nr:unnamed protein product [Ceutorhynchus assimilis]
MLLRVTFLMILPSIFALNFSEGRSYFFKTKTNAGNNNEFTVYNRMHFLNHNISDYDVNPHPPQNIKVVKVNPRNHLGNNSSELRNGVPKKFYLDPEWDYYHEEKPINKSQLPVFIKKIYEQRLRDTNKTDTVRIYFNSNRNRSKVFKFDFELKAGENITDADMYFYWPLENTSSIFKTSVVLKLYQFEKLDNSALNESNLVENPDIHRLFNVIYIAKAQKGWQTFKIKKPLDNWNNGEDNLGLLLTISTYEDNKLISIFSDTNQGALRTFAVLNIENSNASISTSINQNQTSTSKFTPTCSKRQFRINFSHFHWDKFILFPENGLTIYECAGKCHNFQENNHVKLRLLAHGTREKICCVPTGYWSYPIMFANKFGNVVLKNYGDIVVKQCGCR